MFNLRPRRKQAPQPINLNLPKSWNQLTPEQIEGVSRILIQHARTYTQTGIWNRTELLCQCFFLLSGLEVIEQTPQPPLGGAFPNEPQATVPEGSPEGIPETPEPDDISDDWETLPLKGAGGSVLCQFVEPEKRRRYQTYDGAIRPIEITLMEIAELTIGHFELNKKGEPEEVPGPLNWILKPSDLTNFPYPELTVADPPAPFRGSNQATVPSVTEGNRKIANRKSLNRTVTLAGPAPLMDGMSWRQYRICSDYMQSLQKFENHLLTIQKNSAAYGTERLNRQRELVDEVRAQFLANLFCRSIRHIDPETGQPTDGYYYVSSQCMDNAYLFRNFPEEKYQAILLWWQGMMRYLSRQYPKVFRTEKKIGKADPLNDPLKLYTRSTTTMIKYTGASEEDVNRTSYSIVLQQMQDMADENDRMKEIQNSRKK